MKYITLVMVLLLAGCGTAPVKRNFPELPTSLTTTCESIEMIPETKKLSVVLTVVAKNYAQYQECSIKVDTWLMWYEEQKKIFDSVK
jgi:hypothetical protein